VPTAPTTVKAEVKNWRLDLSTPSLFIIELSRLGLRFYEHIIL
jgi:hypothetical protein